MAYLKPSDHKAIAWWAQSRKLVAQLSTPPTIYFKDDKGVETSVNLFSLVTLYKAWLDEEKKKSKRKAAA